MSAELGYGLGAVQHHVDPTMRTRQGGWHMSRSTILWRLAPALAVVIMAPANATAGAETKTPATAPIPIDGPAAWFPQSAFPAAARRADQEGRVAFKLAIDAQGGVVGCTITTSSGSEALDAGTCDLAHTNGHFKPALDGRGKAVPGNWTGAVRWELEKQAPIPAVSFSQVGRFEISADGALISCVVDSKGPVPEVAVGNPCEAFKSALEVFTLKGPLRDQPVRATVQMALVMDGDPNFPEEHRIAGRTTMYASRAHFDIAPSGDVINCKTLEAQILARGDAGPIDLCRAPIGPYVLVTGADAIKPRSATVLMSLSIEPLKP